MSETQQSSNSSSQIRLAVLDDYTSTSTPHFTPLTTHNPELQIDNLPQTQHIHPDNPESLHAQITRLHPYNIISSMRERTAFPRALLSALPNLKLLLTTGPYNAAIDLDAANDCGIVVVGTQTRWPGNTNEQTWALILAVAKRVADGDQRMKAVGGFNNGVDVDSISGGTHGWQEGMGLRLQGRALGVLGLGRLGVECAVTGKLGFGMNVVAWSANLTQERADEIATARGLGDGAIRVAKSKEELFREADVLSVHYVLSDRSRGIVGEKELRLMKKDAILINTSRGPLIDEASLVEALKNRQITGVGLDVFDIEPLPADSVWRSQEWGSRVVLSPHMGYVEEDNMNYWYEQQAENVRRWLNEEEVVGLLKKRPGK